ncbi:hypothetical protein PRIPAC_85883 [Pristionchus pacificus]|uniref:Uncharacterized protein n=1 Tax=Pristionchus pacificus TaxID=54126 RepID=A0A2A6BSI4_PRIPA|nr:hypothetical protein PRIPAC_85883 [Pristionchus pacificus]|eukprot:PDM68786.1 hypothetical protein PRIPAC_47088 [Pristionchus pacificus]
MSLSVVIDIMDFFALPEVFHRELLKKVNIADRMNLRCTCRAFEKLVANSNAGYYESGKIAPTRDGRFFSVYLGDQQFNSMHLSEIGLDTFLQFQNRLFSRIHFNDFEIKMSEYISTQFIREFTEKFAIDSLHFSASTSDQLYRSVELMGDFPKSTHNLAIYDFAPETEAFLMIPPLNILQMYFIKQGTPDNRYEIPTAIFMYLQQNHSSVLASYVRMNSEGFLRVLQLCSNGTGERTIRFLKESLMVASWLRDYGVTEDSIVGDTCGEFLVIKTNIRSTKLRYRNCFILFSGFNWVDDWATTVIVTNFEGEQVE